MPGNIFFKVMAESINAIDFFEKACGFIPYWGTNERECVLSYDSLSK